AEDGIRDFHVTGVQTCALPICEVAAIAAASDDPAAKVRQIVRAHIRSVIENTSIAAAVIFESRALLDVPDARDRVAARRDELERSEERRVGKDGRSQLPIEPDG